MTSKQPLKQSISLIKKRKHQVDYLQKVVVYTNSYTSWSQISSSKKGEAKGVKPKVLSKDCIFTHVVFICWFIVPFLCIFPFKFSN